MNYRTGKIVLFVLALLFIAVTFGCGGGGSVRGSSIHYDMHYGNPWYGYGGGFPPPHYMGPPPIMIPPDIPEVPEMPPLEAVPLPM